MPKILNDERDPVKRALGEKLRGLVREDKKDGGSRFIEFLMNAGLAESEIKDIQYDPEVWTRDEQHINLSDAPRYTVVLTGRGWGKQMEKSLKINSLNKGLTTVGEIRKGDILYGHDLRPTKVVDIQEAPPEVCYRINFSTGEPIIVDERHLWTVVAKGEEYRDDWYVGASTMQTSELCDCFEEVCIPTKGGVITIENMEVIDDTGNGFCCFTVDNDSKLFMVGETMIPTHNSWSLGYTIYRLMEKHKMNVVSVTCRTSRDIKVTIVPAILQFYDEKDPKRPIFNKHQNILEYPDGGTVICYSGEQGADAVRGGNFQVSLIDEAFFMGSNEEIIHNIDYATRLEPALMLAFSSPFASELALDWYQQYQGGNENFRFITGTSFANMDNLAESMKASLESKMNTLQGRREVMGELILENAEALWNMQTIEDNLVRQPDLPKMVEISCGIDPSINSKGQGSKGREADKTGIVVAGLGEDGLLYVLDDFTNSYTVEKWVLKVCEIYDYYMDEVGKVKLQMESNVIGKQAMKHIFLNVDRLDVFRVIDFQFSTQSKMQRLQPYSLLAEQGKIRYSDKRSLSELFKELCSFTGKGKKSPDRADAFVFAMNQIEPAKKKFTKVYDLIL